MIEPDVTAVLGRRLLAFLLDSSLVAATGLGVAFQNSTAFSVVGRDPEDKALVDPAEFEAMEAMLDFEILGQSEILGFPIVRAQELGDSVRVFGEDSYVSGLSAAAIAAVVLFGVIPILLQRTLGMLPLGLGIRRTDGSRAGIVSHLVRTVVGFIDAIPFVIPGALGFIAARSSSHRQRLGDRFAKTTVVDVKALRSSLEFPSVPSPEEAAPLSAETDSSTLDDADVETPDRETTSGLTAAGAAAMSDSPTSDIAAADPSSVADEPPVDERPFAATPPEINTSAKPPVAKPTFGDPLPPPPVHRKSPSEHPLGTPSREAEDLPSVDEPAPAFDPATEVDAPTIVDPGVEPTLPLDSGEIDAAADAGAAESSDLPERKAAPDRAWEPPREEPAPVWQPTALETAPVESPDPSDGRTLDDVERIDPSIGALLADAPADDAGDDSSRSGKHSTTESSAKTPVWSDKWRAWMYWDTSKKCWLRHDAASNTWQPVD